VTKMLCVSLGTFSKFTSFLLCCAILILSCTYDHFRLAEGVSKKMANIVFDKAARKVIKDAVKYAPCLYRLILLVGIVAFIVIFVVFNDKCLSYNNICCTTHRC
jgi:hypothetical protein